MLKKSEKVRKQFFHQRGLSIAEWAKQHGFNRALVYAVLSGRRKAIRGQTFAIARSLGLLIGQPGTEGLLADQGVDMVQARAARPSVRPIEARMRELLVELDGIITKQKRAGPRNPKAT